MRVNANREAIFGYIRTSTKKNGYPPSVREIGESVGGISTSTVHHHLHKLAQDGRIKWNPTMNRTIVVLKGGA